MPILTVELVVDDGELLEPSLARSLADAAGELFGSAAGRTWVRVHALPAHQYAENGLAPGATLHPVFVTLLKATPPRADELQHEVTQLTDAVARICQRPVENVHLIYAPAAAGRVAFGGKVVG